MGSETTNERTMVPRMRQGFVSVKTSKDEAVEKSKSFNLGAYDP